MSIASEITRLQTAKADIKTAIEAKGVTVPSNATLDTYDDYVAQISGGGDDKLKLLVDGSITGITENDLGGLYIIRDYAFCLCRNLQSLELAGTIQRIGDYAFSGCTGLSGTIQISPQVTYVGSYAFKGCHNVNNLIINTTSAATFGNFCFNEIGSATTGMNITVKPNLTASGSMFRSARVNSINFEGGLHFAGTQMLYQTTANTLTIHGDALTGGTTSTNGFLYQAIGVQKTGCHLKDVVITSGQTGIGKYCFYSGLSITSINMSAATDTTSIGQNAFDNCVAMTTCILPPNVTTIDTSAFRNCMSLTAVTVPSSVTSVGATCFSGSSALTYVRFTSTTPPTLGGSGVFAGTNSCPIYVPSGSVDTYKTADVWSGWADRIQAWTGGD